MSVWQDTNGRLHDDMDGAALSLPAWPRGMVQLTEDEEKRLQDQAATPVTPPITPQSAEQKLAAYLAANPDVLALVTGK